MRRILVLGATGRTGRAVVAQALARGYDVTAFVRDRARLTTRDDRLHVVVGALPENHEALADAIRNQDAVISTLGVPGFTPGGLIANAAPVILRAMADAGVRRLIFMSAYGVGDTWRDTPTLPRLFIRTLLRRVYADKLAGEHDIVRSGLDWTIVYPTTLTDKPATGHVRAGERLRLRGLPMIPRADVAAFLVGQIEDATFIRKGVLLAGDPPAAG